MVVSFTASSKDIIFGTSLSATTIFTNVRNTHLTVILVSQYVVYHLLEETIVTSDVDEPSLHSHDSCFEKMLRNTCFILTHRLIAVVCLVHVLLPPNDHIDFVHTETSGACGKEEILRQGLVSLRRVDPVMYVQRTRLCSHGRIWLMSRSLVMEYA